MIHQESFFLASYDLSNDMFSILDYSAGNLDTLYTIPFSGNGSERGNHLTVIGENLVFRIADNCYRYNLVTEMGSLVAPVNTGTYGFGSYFSTLMRYSELSVNDNSAELLELYPNPTAGLVNIKSEKIREYQIYSAEGRLLKTGTLTTGLNQINITDLNSGTYSLKSELGIQMIVKQ